MSKPSRLGARAMARLQKGTRVLAGVRAHPHTKPLGQLLYEALEYGVRRREAPAYYLAALMYREGVRNPSDYLSYREIARIERLVLDSARVPFFKNKVLFHYHFANAGVRLPVLLGYNLGRWFFSATGPRAIDTPERLACLVKELIGRSSSASIFLKPVGGTSGKDCYRIYGDDLDRQDAGVWLEAVRSANYIFEETIRQHPRIDAVHPASVNTLRVTTCMVAGRPALIHGIMRFGAGGRHVDNTSAGGVYVGVDLATGEVSATGRRQARYGAAEYARHPDTGVEFAGLVIPHLAEAREAVLAAAAHLPYSLAGWDVAITEDGPVLIEGNNKPDLKSVDITLDGCKAHPAFGAFLRELGIANKSEHRMAGVLPAGGVQAS